ncbi:MAG: aryl-sulfate sulfotransferase, partial [Flavobacteriales bacterium]
MNKQIFTLIILIGSSLNLVGQIFNRPIPEDFPKYEFRKPGTSSSEGYFLFTPIRLFQQSAPRHLAMFDDDGYLTWSANKGTTRCANFEYHPEFEVFSFASDDNSTSEMKFHIMDLSFSLIDSVVPTAGNQTDIHDFRILDNGNYLISGITSTNEDLSSYTFNGVQGANPTTVLSFVLQEFENGNLVFDWKSIDHIHPEEFIETYNYDSTGFDYVHGNAVEEDADGDFWISMRHTDALYKIDRVTGEILWTLGGQSSDFDFVNDDGFSGQHDIRVLPNGNLTLFDNGNSRSAPRFSRAVEYELDFTDSTATPVWEYQNEFNSYSRAMGSFRTNADDEHTIGYGFCYRPVSNLIHLDSQDEIISELLFQDSVVSYRALRAELTAPIERPEIVCAVAANQTTLSAPSGYSTYKWSTGELTQQITVSETDTYQVWV